MILCQVYSCPSICQLEVNLYRLFTQRQALRCKWWLQKSRGLNSHSQGHKTKCFDVIKCQMLPNGSNQKPFTINITAGPSRVHPCIKVHEAININSVDRHYHELDFVNWWLQYLWKPVIKSHNYLYISFHYFKTEHIFSINTPPSNYCYILVLIVHVLSICELPVLLKL